MIDRISSDFNFLQTSIGLRQHRMELLSSNIANADTPGFKARDFNFAEALNQAMGVEGSPQNVNLKMTSNRHIPAHGDSPLQFSPQYRTPFQESMDNNTVEMDVERMQFADNTLQQQAALSFINGKIRTLAAALQPPN